MVSILFLLAAVSAAQAPDAANTVAPAEAARLESKFLANVHQVTFDGQSGEGYFSPDDSRIIFQSIRGQHPFYQIYIKDLARGEERMVSTGYGRTTCAYFHPTRPRILFASSHLDPHRDDVAREEVKRLEAQRKNPQRRRGYDWNYDPYMDIFEADLDGANLVRLTDAHGYDAEGSYSPDGKQIVFCSFRTGKGDIYLMDADGKNVRKLAGSPEGHDGGPFFSPDGKRIIFRGEAGKPDLLQLFVINADGSGQRQLTHNDAVNWGPYWHADGKHIIFATSLHGHMNYELYLLNVDNPAELERVTYTFGADVLPVFNRTGTKLMWTTRRGKNRAGETSSQLWMADWVYPPPSGPGK